MVRREYFLLLRDNFFLFLLFDRYILPHFFNFFFSTIKNLLLIFHFLFAFLNLFLNIIYFILQVISQCLDPILSTLAHILLRDQKAQLLLLLLDLLLLVLRLVHLIHQESHLHFHHSRLVLPFQQWQLHCLSTVLHQLVNIAETTPQHIFLIIIKYLVTKEIDDVDVESDSEFLIEDRTLASFVVMFGLQDLFTIEDTDERVHITEGVFTVQ